MVGQVNTDMRAIWDLLVENSGLADKRRAAQLFSKMAAGIEAALAEARSEGARIATIAAELRRAKKQALDDEVPF